MKLPHVTNTMQYFLIPTELLLNENMAAFPPALASFSRPPCKHGRNNGSDTCYHT